MKHRLLAVAIAGLTAPNFAAASVFMSEYIEGSSNNKAIEIFNGGDAAVNLTDYELVFYFNGNTNAGYRIALEGSLPVNQTYVTSHSLAAAEILALAQLTKGGGWFNGDDAIVLEKAGEVIDSIGQIGTDPGSQWNVNSVSTADNTLRRIDGSAADTNPFDAFDPSVAWVQFANNDFSDLGSYLGSVGDGNGDDDDTPAEPSLELGSCGAPATFISAVQGAGASSPLDGQQVVVEAVVTASFQGSDQLSGFFIQEELADQDNNSATAEGVFVFSREPVVGVGDLVRLLATVGEYSGATQLTNIEAALLCGSASLPNSVKIELPVAEAFAWEALEGMRVELEQQLTVTDNYTLARFGEFDVAPERLYIPTQIVAPGAAAQAQAALNQRSKLLIDDGSSRQNPALVAYPSPELSAANSLRVGTELLGVKGVLSEGFGEYRVQPTQPLTFVATNPRTPAPELPGDGELRVAAFNVLNYFNGDGQGAGFPTPRGADSATELARQEAKLIAALIALEADIIGLVEMENDGFGETSALASLVTELNREVGEARWAYVDFGVSNIGTDAITNAIIYRQDVLQPQGMPAFTTQVLFDYGSRAPVLQSFIDTRNGDGFQFLVAHLRSKGSCSGAEGADRDTGDGQGCWNATRVTAVNTMLDWLATAPTGYTDDDVIIVGDMNAYAMEDPIAAFTARGWVDLKSTWLGNRHHSYVFQGESGSLDHAFASPAMAAKITGVTDWLINADEPIALDYNEEFKSPQQLATFFAPDAYRSSDHDPVVIEVNTQREFKQDFGLITGNPGWQRFSFELPANMKVLRVMTQGGSGALELRVEHQRQPSQGHADCVASGNGTEQLCTLLRPAAGTWHIAVRGLRPAKQGRGSYQNVGLAVQAND